MKLILKQIKTASLLLIILTILTGVLYPLGITFIAQKVFSKKANGSIIYQNKIPLGSRFIGQYFTLDKYFWGRPSETNFHPYNALESKGSNLSPTNPELIAKIKVRSDFQIKNAGNGILVPIDLVTASGSGLDPEVSPLAAYYQAKRVAKARNLSLQEVKNLIATKIMPKQFGILGEPRVNVLELNLALDELRKK